MTRIPRLAALAVLPHRGRVLLVRRARPPDAGLWGYPGGHVEWGETAFAAAEREMAEETGVTARAEAWLTNLDIIRQADGAVTHHFLLAAVLCRYVGGTPVAADDAAEAEWVTFVDVENGARPMSRDVAAVLRLAIAR